MLRKGDVLSMEDQAWRLELVVALGPGSGIVPIGIFPELQGWRDDRCVLMALIVVPLM